MKSLSLLLPLMVLACSNAPSPTNQASTIPGEYRYQVDYVYDGDTLYIKMPELPVELQKIGVRVRGIDAPEIHGRCAAEKQGAQQARAFTYRLLKQTGGMVYLRNIKWDKFGGRIDADVLLGEQRTSLARALLEQKLATPYLGEHRDKMKWCS